jgi:hypothetical protein
VGRVSGKDSFPELKWYDPGKFFRGCGGGNAGDIAAGMRQARHETATGRMAGRKDRVIQGQGARGAPEGDHIRVKTDQNRPPPDQPIEGGNLNYGRPSSQRRAMLAEDAPFDDLVCPPRQRRRNRQLEVSQSSG